MPSSIISISISKLFGRYTYRLSNHLSGGDISKLFILYGDNGSGKTTILRTIFHLLRGEARRGHKTALARTPFASLEVRFDDGTIVAVDRSKGELLGSYDLTIVRGGIPATFTVDVDNEKNVVTPRKVALLLQALKDLDLHLYMLPDDRKLRGIPPEFSDEVFAPVEPEIAYDRHGRRQMAGPEDLSKSLVLGTLRRFEFWIRRQALEASSVGQEDSDHIYASVLRQIVSLPRDQSESDVAPLHALRARVMELGERAASFSKYGLVPPFQADAIRALLDNAPPHVHTAAYRVLDPYVEGLTARLNALADSQRIINAFINSINGFFSDKHVTFDLGSGLRICLEDGAQLSPELLSSGERQLLILLANCATAPAGAIFLVDEPELSLNIKWQRQLTKALLACTAHGKVQFVLATHSFELLAGHRECVVPLQPEE